jgi:hypothetical protein
VAHRWTNNGFTLTPLQSPLQGRQNLTQQFFLSLLIVYLLLMRLKKTVAPIEKNVKYPLISNPNGEI